MNKRQQYNTQVQSLTRGMQVLQLLARNGRMTASAIGAELGVHQSSASRLLRSLQDAGFVRKPDFHSFAIDYGALLFAGVAMQGFAEIAASAQAAMAVHARTGYGAAAAVLRENRLIYLAHMGSAPQAAIRLIDDSTFPVHRSSLGLCLAATAGPDTLRDTVLASCRRCDVRKPEAETRSILAMVDDSLQRYDFVLLCDQAPNRFNGAMTFQTPRGPAAFAIYSDRQNARPDDVKRLLEDAVRQIAAALQPPP
ncbi:MAG: hypothetical protein A3K19_25915 [Lentisphaerae bacterium RIFOXYB12_FULL_65_16]|nr:MAG: hypothetical protein A3K18_24000 [Lentisphaerae bacterium RIFOXYA12_64_32]OGV91408.1 MAG: hypothetical protein A3K19_25915 [Lentisphaerae bacterium RIFOXYB12_FULL_65_16]